MGRSDSAQEDAQAVWQQSLKWLPEWLDVSVEPTSQDVFEGRGRPARDAKPNAQRWSATSTIVLDECKLQVYARRKACFVIASNVVGEAEVVSFFSDLYRNKFSPVLHLQQFSNSIISGPEYNANTQGPSLPRENLLSARSPKKLDTFDDISWIVPRTGVWTGELVKKTLSLREAHGFHSNPCKSGPTLHRGKNDLEEQDYNRQNRINFALFRT